MYIEISKLIITSFWLWCLLFQIHSLVLSIDGANRTLSSKERKSPPFAYIQDPTVMEIKPLRSFVSGGRMITVHGTNLDTIQKPEMVVYSDSSLNPINKSVSFWHWYSAVVITSFLVENCNCKTRFKQTFHRVSDVNESGCSGGPPTPGSLILCLRTSRKYSVIT